METKLSDFEIKKIARAVFEEMTEIESPLALLSANEIASRYVGLSPTLVRELWDKNLIPFVLKKSIRVSFKKDVEAYLQKISQGYNDGIFSMPSPTVDDFIPEDTEANRIALARFDKALGLNNFNKKRKVV